MDLQRKLPTFNKNKRKNKTNWKKLFLKQIN